MNFIRWLFQCFSQTVAQKFVLWFKSYYFWIICGILCSSWIMEWNESEMSLWFVERKKKQNEEIIWVDNSRSWIVVFNNTSTIHLCGAYIQNQGLILQFICNCGRNMKCIRKYLKHTVQKRCMHFQDQVRFSNIFPH